MDKRQESNPRDVINVHASGAVGDGRTLETRSLQAALDICRQQDGGTVFIPAGRYLTGTLFLHSNTTLHLDSGAVLLGSEDPADYPVMPGRWEGAEQETHAPLITGQNLHNVAVTGRGIVDGRGETWWNRWKENTLDYPRPRLISLADCENVLVEGITLQNSPAWTLHPVRCTNVSVRGVTILNPADSPNTDGINPDSCCAVRISDCHISSGDDCIAIKAGSENERPDRRAPARDITIANCTLERGHGGIVIGSETSGDIRHVAVSNCVFVGTDRGIRIKSRRGRGGTVEDIRASNLIMRGVLCPFTVNPYYSCGAQGNPRVSEKNPLPLDEGTPRIRRIHLSQITAREVQYAAGFVYGLPELPLEDIFLSDVSIELAADSEAGFPEMAEGLERIRQGGFFLRHTNRLTLQNIEISGQSGPAFRVQDSSDVFLHSCGSPAPDPGSPVVSMSNVSNAVLQACHAGADTEAFLFLEGVRSRNVSLHGISRLRARKPLELAPGIPPEAAWVEPREDI